MVLERMFKFPGSLLFASLGLLLCVGCLEGADEDAGRPKPPEIDPSVQDPSVVFSHGGGFHELEFDLTLESSTPGSVIRYTLDGSEPDESSTRYKKPLRIADRSGEPNGISEIPTTSITEGALRWRSPNGEVFKGTVVRARAWDEKTQVPGPIATVSYFVGPDLSSRFPLPVVSLSGDPDDFFGDEWGIYVPGSGYDPEKGGSENYYRLTGRAGEIRVHFEFFEPGGFPGLSFMAGTRIHGAYSRRTPQKSLRLYLRNEYGLKHIDYPLFPDEGIRRFKRFILRNSGNDWVFTMILDSLGQALAKGTRVDRQSHRSAVVFINGEYWGIQQFRDRLDARHFAYKYGVNHEDVVTLDNHKDIGDGSKADLEAYADLLTAVGDKGIKSFHDYETVLTQVDLDTFVDYQVINIYAHNHDWPFNNVKVWRHRVDPDIAAPFGKDGRWRFAMFDLDLAFAWNSERYAGDSLAHALDPDLEVKQSTTLFRSLMEFEYFQKRFLLRFSDHLNSRFRSDNVISLVDALAEEIAASLPEHILRWWAPKDMATWEKDLEMQRSFARKRPQAMREILANHLGFERWHELELGFAGQGSGLIRLNNHLTLDGTETWSGLYPENVDLQFRAHALPGSCFAGWEGQANPSPLLTTKLKSGGKFSARFLAIGDPECLPNPVPHRLADSDYLLREWSDLEPAGAHPPSMQFQMGLEKDDTLSNPAMVSGVPCAYEGAYDLDSGTRVSGHGEFGLSVVNTASTPHCGWVDSVLLSLDTRQIEKPRLSFTAGTLAQNSRIHAFRLQYRVGSSGVFRDVLDSSGEVVEYVAKKSGHSKRFERIALPESLSGHPEVQLRWKYYFTGVRLSKDEGARSQLRLDDVEVSASPES